jgi:osmotically-inducible protein OsmY
MKLKIHAALSISAMAIPMLLVVSGCQMKNSSESGNSSSTNTLFINTNSSTMGATSNSAAADNSQNNLRDRDSSNQTPIDQGNSPADLQLTQQIRKMVASGTNNFSVIAQNIKIITDNGQVTLRGPVQSDAEKTSIDSIAKGVAGETNVTDQLEVKNSQ